MRGLTLGAADEQVGQCEGAGDNSYRSSVVKALAWLAADPCGVMPPLYQYRHRCATFDLRLHHRTPARTHRRFFRNLREDCPPSLFGNSDYGTSLRDGAAYSCRRTG